MRIAVIGYSGSGKSTLARALGSWYHCKVLHLDKIQFVRGWQERDRSEALILVKDFMDRDSWVIDGNYTGFLQAKRLEEADQIVFLNFSRWSCLYRAWRRYCRFRGRTRGDMAEGCEEKLDLEFIRWILWEGRTLDVRRHYREILERYPEKTVILRTQRQINRYLEVLPC